MRSQTTLIWALICAAGISALSAFAQDNSRYERLAHEFRCLVCHNQSLAESNAELAQDLKAELRALIAQGKSDEQIKQFMQIRYGDFVLYKPPVQGNTWALWFGPFFALAFGAIIVRKILMRRRNLIAHKTSTEPLLTEAERNELNAHLK